MSRFFMSLCDAVTLLIAVVVVIVAFAVIALAFGLTLDAVCGWMNGPDSFDTF